MRALKKLIKFFIFTIVLFGGINLFLEYRFKSKLKLPEKTYKWKHGDISYSKSGSGMPILLIHDLLHGQSSDSLKDLQDELEKNYTVYNIDLIGCGVSERPPIIYTNYLYVQLINDFIKDVIKESCVVVSLKTSAAITMMASTLEEANFKKLVLVEPDYKKEIGVKNISRLRDILRKAIFIPVYGTFAYNMYCLLTGLPFAKDGKYFLASKIAGFLNTTTTKSISELTVDTSTIDDYESMYHLAEEVKDLL